MNSCLLFGWSLCSVFAVACSSSRSKSVNLQDVTAVKGHVLPNGSPLSASNDNSIANKRRIEPQTTGALVEPFPPTRGPIRRLPYVILQSLRCIKPQPGGDDETQIHVEPLSLPWGRHGGRDIGKRKKYVENTVHELGYEISLGNGIRVVAVEIDHWVWMPDARSPIGIVEIPANSGAGYYNLPLKLPAGNVNGVYQIQYKVVK